MMETFHQKFANMFTFQSWKSLILGAIKSLAKERGGKSIKIYVYANLLSFANDECDNIFLEMKYISVVLHYINGAILK